MQCHWMGLYHQAWYLTEAIASVAPGLCLGALSKVPTKIYKFLIEVPFAKEKSPCPFKYKVSGLYHHLSIEEPDETLNILLSLLEEQIT